MSSETSSQDSELEVSNSYVEDLDEGLSHAYQLVPNLVLTLPDHTELCSFREAMVHILSSQNGAAADVQRSLLTAGFPHVSDQMPNAAIWRECYAEVLQGH